MFELLLLFLELGAELVNFNLTETFFLFEFLNLRHQACILSGQRNNFLSYLRTLFSIFFLQFPYFPLLLFQNPLQMLNLLFLHISQSYRLILLIFYLHIPLYQRFFQSFFCSHARFFRLSYMLQKNLILIL